MLNSLLRFLLRMGCDYHFLCQVMLTGRLLTAFGLIPSLFLLPVSLFAGSLVILIWPGVFSSTMTRVTDAVMRPSVNQSSMEILYLPLPANLKKHVKTFLDVVLQRLGDGVAGLIVLFYALFMMPYEPATLAHFSLGLIVIWTVFIFLLRGDYLAALVPDSKHRRLPGRQKRLTMLISKPSPPSRCTATVPQSGTKRSSFSTIC
jgi:ATP/ADP translocase